MRGREAGDHGWRWVYRGKRSHQLRERETLEPPAALRVEVLTPRARIVGLPEDSQSAR